MAEGTQNSIEERHRRIKEYIDKVKRIEVNDLIQKFGVSPSTMRTDLSALENEGLIRRTHGWAMSFSQNRVGYETTTDSRMIEEVIFKQEIARAANNEINDGDVIAILAGSTGFYFAQTLTNKKDLTIAVDDISIAKWLNDNTDHKLLILGGFARRKYSYIHVNEMTSIINIDKAFFSCTGFDADSGATVSDLELAMSEHGILSRANKIYLLCDSTKFGGVYFAQVCPSQDVNMIITDSHISAENEELLKKRFPGRLVVAEK